MRNITKIAIASLFAILVGNYIYQTRVVESPELNKFENAVEQHDSTMKEIERLREEMRQQREENQNVIKEEEEMTQELYLNNTFHRQALMQKRLKNGQGVTTSDGKP